MVSWQAVGKHQYYLQDDLLVVQVHGVLELADAQWLLTTLFDLVQRYGYSLLLADVHQGMSIPPHVRKWIGQWHNSHSATDGSAVVVGAGRMIRTLLTMINSAVRLLGLPTGDLAFAKSEADGWAVIAERRAGWQARLLAKRTGAK
jgi:hypothetical protein